MWKILKKIKCSLFICCGSKCSYNEKTNTITITEQEQEDKNNN